jgi:hypothetical protein
MSITVSFKDEGGELGPVAVIDREIYERDPVVAQGGVGIPYGYKPQGLPELGWLTRSEALAVAASHGVTLEEW